MHFRSLVQCVEHLEFAPRDAVLIEDLGVALSIFEECYAFYEKRLLAELCKTVQTVWQPLEDASTSVGSVTNLADSLPDCQTQQIRQAGMETIVDPFGPLHESTVLSTLSTISCMVEPNQSSTSEIDVEDEDEPRKTGTEFTLSDLQRMRRAIQTGQPAVDGVLLLVQRALSHYGLVCQVLRDIYGNESMLMALPTQIKDNKSLLEMVRRLSDAWTDAQNVLMPTREKDLIVLNEQLKRNEDLVLHVLAMNGRRAAAVLLARLCIVDEMPLDPKERKMTGPVPWLLRKEYRAVEQGLHELTREDVTLMKRRLCCPHYYQDLALADYVRRQILMKLPSLQVALDSMPFDPGKGVCAEETWLLLDLLHLTLDEKTARRVYQAIDEDCDGIVTVEEIKSFLRKGIATHPRPSKRFVCPLCVTTGVQMPSSMPFRSFTANRLWRATERNLRHVAQIGQLLAAVLEQHWTWKKQRRARRQSASKSNRNHSSSKSHVRCARIFSWSRKKGNIFIG
jgi:hypothetical protein